LRITVRRKFLLLAFSTLLLACELIPTSVVAKELRYYYRITRFPASTPDSALVQFDIAIPYSRMVFAFRDSAYRAEIRFNLYVLDPDENLLFERDWRHHLSVPRYDETLSDSLFLQFATKALLARGKYKVVFESLDENVGISRYRKLDLRIPDYSRYALALSDLLLLSGRHDLARETVTALPVSPRAVIPRDFTVYAEALLLKDVPDLQATFLWQDRFRTVRKDTASIVRVGQRLRIFRAYTIREAPLGRYVVELKVEAKGIRTQRSATEVEIVKQIQFYSEEALNRAIQQLVYIGEGAAYDSLLHAKTFAAKKYWFNRFWQEYYPAADSLNNPVREEYYRRVRYANRHFGDGMEGWRTDRGRIYILYGPPDSIERTMDQNMRNYEVWIYEKLQRKFVFAEDSAFGEYRLIREM